MSNQSEKLPRKVKLSYSLLNSIPNLQMLLQMYYLVYFYVNILGISGTAAGLIIMVARIWDFINDPMMGVLVEKTRKPNKCLYWMKRALVPVAIFMVLTFTAPNLSNTAKIIWVIVTFICLGMSQTMFSIPKDSLQPMLTRNREERAKLNVYNRVFSTLFNMLIPTITMPLVALLQGYGVNSAFMKVAAIYAVAYIALGFLGIKGCEGYEEDEQLVAVKQSPKAGQMFAELLKNQNALLIIVLQTIKMLFSSIATAVMVYFCTYNMGNANYQSMISTVSSIVGYISIVFLMAMFRKFGNAGTGLVGAIWSTVCFVLICAVYLMGAPMILLVILVGISALGSNMVTAVIPQCLMDAVDYNEYKTGHKNTAVIMSAYGIGNKIGLAFGSTIAAFALDLINFDPEATTQPAHVLSMFFHMTVTAQIVIYIAMGLIFLALFRTEKKLPQIRAELEQRKTQTAAQQQ